MLRNSIRGRLLLLACVPPGAALVLVLAGTLIYGFYSAREGRARRLQSQAQLLAANCRGVLAFQDQQAGGTLLESLRHERTVRSAILLDAERKPLARYQQDATLQLADSPLPTPFAGYRFTSDGCMEVMQPVRESGELLGYLVIRAGLDDVWDDLWQHVRISGALLVAAACIAALLANRLKQSITTPIDSLTEAATRIATDRDFSIRVSGHAEAELGRLQEAFNCMVDQVQRSERKLQESHDRLEQRVEERTRALRQEIACRQETQQALEHARDVAEAASQAKSSFLANMSHEIRTPMTAILGFADLLMEDGDIERAPARRVEAIRTIQRNGEHLLSIINDILDVSKIEAGKMTVEQIDVSPAQIVYDVLSLMQVRAGEKNLELKAVWEGLVPATMRTDPTRLRQILVNLVGNAVKFTERGSVTIRVVFNGADPQCPRMQFTVRDTGIGIAPEQVEQLFGAFAQADSSMTRRFGGTGLGLVISQRFAEMLGGRIAVESELGRGSAFTVTVATGPLNGVEMIEPKWQNSEMSLEQHRLTARMRTSPDGTPLTGRRVLLVEDGLDNQRLITLMLRKTGATVTVAENGQEAIELLTVDGTIDGDLLANIPYDIILMDMQMPVMDGYTAAAILRAKGNTTPVLALTAHALQSERDKCLAAGCDDYLTKPIDRHTLIAHAVAAVKRSHPATGGGKLAPRSAT